MKKKVGVFLEEIREVCRKHKLQIMASCYYDEHNDEYATIEIRDLRYGRPEICSEEAEDCIEDRTIPEDEKEIGGHSNHDLFDADPNCQHEIDAKWSGIKCKKCGGWFCY